MNIIETTKDPDLIREMIMRVDRNKIKKLLMVGYAESYAYNEDSSYIKETSDEVVDWYIRQWAESKYEFYVMFGRKFKIEEDFEYEPTFNDYCSIIDDVKLQFPQFAFTLCRISNGQIINNLVDYSVKDRLSPYIKCKEGQKISKVFSSLFNSNEFDMEYSKIFQNKKVVAKLVVSIDPLDYLFMSINKASWGSCYDIRCGCYSNAAYAHMIDSASIV